MECGKSMGEAREERGRSFGGEWLEHGKVRADRGRDRGRSAGGVMAEFGQRMGGGFPAEAGR